MGELRTAVTHQGFCQGSIVPHPQTLVQVPVALSWAQHLSPRAQPRPLMPWLARSVGETPHHTLCRGSLQGPCSPQLPTAQTVLWAGHSQKQTPPSPAGQSKPTHLGKTSENQQPTLGSIQNHATKWSRNRSNTQFPWQRPHAGGLPPGECGRGAGGPRLPGTWPTLGAEGPAPFAALCLLQGHGGLGAQGVQEHPRTCRPGQATGEAAPACRTATAPP